MRGVAAVEGGKSMGVIRGFAGWGSGEGEMG